MTILKNELVENEDIFAAFNGEVIQLSVLVIDNGDGISSDLPDLDIGLEPIYAFSLKNLSNEEKTLLIWHYHGCVRVREFKGRAPEIGKFFIARSEYPELVEPVGMVNMNDFIVPFDVTIQLTIKVSRLAIVRDRFGKLYGLLLWFSHDTEIGFVYGYYDELMVLFGNNVTQAYDAALVKRDLGELNVEIRSLAAEESFCKSFHWFEYT